MTLSSNKNESSEEVHERLDTFIRKYLGSNISAFAKRLDVNPTIIRNICKSRRSKPSYMIIKKILDEFPELNSRWFITGEGQMLINTPYESKAPVAEYNKERVDKLEAQIQTLIQTVHNLSRELSDK